MANFLDITRSLVIEVAKGLSSTGKQLKKSYTFKGLSETAAADAVKQAADALGSLINGTVVGYYIQDKNQVIEN